MRCINLAKALRTYCDTYFIIPNQYKFPQQLLNTYNLPYITVPKTKNMGDEVTYYPDTINVVIVDMADYEHVQNPEKLSLFFHKLIDRNVRVFLIDGMFQDKLICHDYPFFSTVIQPYVGAEKDTAPNSQEWIAGGAYAILGDAYRDCPRRTTSKQASNVLISFGGSDPQEITVALAEVLSQNRKQFQNQLVRFVLGPDMALTTKQKITGILNDLENAEIIKAPDSLKPLLTEADVAILGSGAASRYEAACCGVPALITSIVPSHDHQCRLHQSYGCTEYLGHYNELSETSWCRALSNLIDDFQKRQSMSLAGQKLIDGRGVERLAVEIGKILA